MPCVCVHSNKCVVATVCAFWCTHIATLRSGQVNMKLFLIHIIAGRLKRPYTVVDSELWIKKSWRFENVQLLKSHSFWNEINCPLRVQGFGHNSLRLSKQIVPNYMSFPVRSSFRYFQKPYRNMFLKMLCIIIIWASAKKKKFALFKLIDVPRLHLYACFSLWSIFIKQ